MTQMPLSLDRFEAARERINAGIEAGAEQALQGIRELAEHHRRSLWQIVRWQFFAMQREGITGNDH